MTLPNSVNVGDIVQIVTDYSLERIGQIQAIKLDFIKLVPYSNEELRKLITSGTNEKLELDYNPSIIWPTVIFTKTIKEIIILKDGEQEVNP